MNRSVMLFVELSMKISKGELKLKNQKFLRFARRPPIMLIGALFAFSFDTFTQVTLFALSASVMAGFLFPIILGAVFMLGMMSSDGLNGYFVSAMIQLADKKSLIVSRVIGVIIACFSLSLGVLGLVNQL
jgi:nickel/cobalt transporter (NiCoT) family protein